MRPAVAPQRRQPLFSEVREGLLADISAGRLSIGSRLPSEPQLALNLRISRPTLREVLRSLEADGVVRRVHGVGTFVARRKPLVHTALDLDVGVTEAVAATSAELGVEIVGIRRVPAAGWVESALELGPGATVLAIERIIKVNGIAAVHGLDMIPGDIVAKSGQPYESGSVYRYLERDCDIELAGGVAEVTAVAATARLARSLSIKRNTPLLRLDQVERSVAGQPVLLSCEHYAPGVFGLMVRRRRHQQAAPIPDARKPTSDRT